MQIGTIVTMKGINHIGRISSPKHLHPRYSSFGKAWIVEWEDGDTTWEMEADLIPVGNGIDCQSDTFCP